MDRPPRAPRHAPPATPERRPRSRAPRPEFLTPDDETGDPFGGSTAHRAATPRRGDSSPSPAVTSRHRAIVSRSGEPQLTLPSMPRLPARQRRGDEHGGAPREQRTWQEQQEWEDQQEWDDWETRRGEPDEPPMRDLDPPALREGTETGAGVRAARGSLERGTGRRRERTSARPLSLMRQRQVADALDVLTRPPAPLGARTGIAPALPAPLSGGVSVALARPRVARRVRTETQRLARAARSPWNAVRFAFALVAITLALLTAAARVGEPLQPLMLHANWSAAGGSRSATPITSLVRPEIQIEQPELYDSYQQFLDWRGAACSAATTSEVLTAWGAKNATIGQVIDRMVPDVSLDGGLINEYGFQRAAAAYGYRADISHNLTYKQMVYITTQLGLPIIVNVRISYGYYHYFDTGHFLVMTAGDDQGVAIVDSSTYYIHYLPLSVFYSMFTNRTYIIVPADYHYSVPAI